VDRRADQTYSSAACWFRSTAVIIAAIALNTARILGWRLASARHRRQSTRQSPPAASRSAPVRYARHRPCRGWGCGGRWQALARPGRHCTPQGRVPPCRPAPGAIIAGYWRRLVGNLRHRRPALGSRHGPRRRHPASGCARRADRQPATLAPSPQGIAAAQAVCPVIFRVEGIGDASCLRLCPVESRSRCQSINRAGRDLDGRRRGRRDRRRFRHGLPPGDDVAYLFRRLGCHWLCQRGGERGWLRGKAAVPRLSTNTGLGSMGHGRACAGSPGP